MWIPIPLITSCVLQLFWVLGWESFYEQKVTC